MTLRRMVALVQVNQALYIGHYFWRNLYNISGRGVVIYFGPPNGKAIADGKIQTHCFHLQIRLPVELMQDTSSSGCGE